ncbi:MAG: tripartite tricarboxylate transporter TctB family protein [Lachnospiraceae bacterium]|jgi:divalent metal cation (Fe/Co/Zn/Cd) transporter|nr:tripartite tricarboxylate transporter TctB family protein [Lachnospiraceae bacterium]
MDKKKTKAFSNLIGAIVFIVFGIWAYLQTNSFKYIKGTVVQPSTFPRVMIIGMLIFSVVLLIQSIWKLRSMDKHDPLAEETESINPKNKSVLAAYAVIGLSILFTALFNVLGYVVVSFLVCMIIMYMIGKRDWPVMIAMSLGVPLLMFFLFHKILQVNMPMGPLSFLTELIDKI